MEQELLLSPPKHW